MALVFSFVIFLLFAAVLSFAGVKMYVKPKEAIERVAGTGMSVHDAAPRVSAFTAERPAAVRSLIELCSVAH